MTILIYGWTFFASHLHKKEHYSTLWLLPVAVLCCQPHNLCASLHTAPIENESAIGFCSHKATIILAQNVLFWSIWTAVKCASITMLRHSNVRPATWSMQMQILSQYFCSNQYSRGNRVPMSITMGYNRQLYSTKNLTLYCNSILIIMLCILQILTDQTIFTVIFHQTQTYSSLKCETVILPVITFTAIYKPVMVSFLDESICSAWSKSSERRCVSLTWIHMYYSKTTKAMEKKQQQKKTICFIYTVCKINPNSGQC